MLAAAGGMAATLGAEPAGSRSLRCGWHLPGHSPALSPCHPTDNLCGVRQEKYEGRKWSLIAAAPIPRFVLEVAVTA